MSSPHPMRILFISLHYAPEPTGNAPYVAALAEALAARGNSVRVLTTHPHYPHWRIQEGYGGWRRDESPRRGLRVTRLRHYVPRSPDTIRRSLAELSFGLRALTTRWGRPDVVVALSPGLLASRVVRLRARRAPSFIVWVQDIYSLGLDETGQGGARLGALLARVERDTLSFPARVMAIHERFGRYLTARLGVADDRVEIVRNWTHLKADDAATDRSAARARLGWADDDFVVLHAGNQGVKQGLGNVVEAARLASPDDRVRFVLLGHGNQNAALRAQGAGVGAVEFIEPLPDADYRRAMLAADVLLVNELPGVAEMSVPSKLTSYFSTGLPVLAATDDGSVTAEEVGAAGAGLRVDAGDPEALLGAARAMRDLPDRGRSLGATGPAYVRAVLSERAAVDHAEAWMERLLADA